MRENKKFYDDAFFEIFSNKKIIASLLKDFIGEEWARRIDPDSMELEETDFKGINTAGRSSDLLLSFRARDDGSIFLYMLLEFQSTVSPMGVRVLEYLARIYSRQEKMEILIRWFR